MRRKLVLSAVISAMLLLTFVACGGGGGSALVGRWDAVSVEIIQDGESFTENLSPGEMSMEFFSDGNGVVVDGRNTDRFTWSAENGRLMITDGWGTEVMDYSISRSTLTITITDNWGTEIMTFRRAN